MSFAFAASKKKTVSTNGGGKVTDSEVNGEKDRWAKTNSVSEAVWMIQNKHLTKANIMAWNYIYGADKIFLQWLIKSGSGKQLRGY